MRALRSFLANGFFGSYEFLALLITGASLISLLSIPQLPRIYAVLSVVPGLLYYFIAARRERMRRKVLREPFPLAWREILVRRVGFYRQLDVQESQRFEQEIQLFLAEQRIYPLRSARGEGVASSGRDAGDGSGHELWRHFPEGLTEEHKVLIAASAATLLIGRPDWRLPTVRDVVVYPMPFSQESYEVGPFGDTVGQVHAFGPIILSLPDLLRAYPVQGSQSVNQVIEIGDLSGPTGNVGIHEFAHVLDFMGADGRAGGLPALIAPEDRQAWAQQLRLEHERLLVGQSVLHPYGTRSDAELFAVAVEAFFMDSVRLRALHGDLYQLMCSLFQQDPAARMLPRHIHWAFRPWFALQQSPTSRPMA